MTRHHARTIRVFTAERGGGPWPCTDCGISLPRLGRQLGNGCLHHDDHDESNDAIENIVILCHSCHRKRHETTELRERITNKLRGAARSVATKQLMSERVKAGYAAGRPPVRSMLGRTHTAETRAKISAARRSRSNA